MLYFIVVSWLSIICHIVGLCWSLLILIVIVDFDCHCCQFVVVVYCSQVVVVVIVVSVVWDCLIVQQNRDPMLVV